MAGMSGSGDGTFTESFYSDNDDSFEGFDTSEIELGEKRVRQRADSTFTRASDDDISDFKMTDDETQPNIEEESDSDASGNQPMTRGRAKQCQSQ